MLFNFCCDTIIDRDASEPLDPFMKGVMTIPWFKGV